MPNPQKIDELHLPDHYYLTPDDYCIFLREYTPRMGYAHSETNNLVDNFKKTMDKRGKKEWYYKERAIGQITIELAHSLKVDWLRTATLVPIPPSKTKANSLYDDRMTQVLRGFSSLRGCQCDVRELIVQTEDMDAVHLRSDSRPTPDELRSVYRIDENLTEPVPRQIGIFDDVITAGSHFRAAKDMLTERFPGINVVGIFVARRVPII